jgi:hypothetical protein
VRIEINERRISCDRCDYTINGGTSDFTELEILVLRKGWLVVSEGEYCPDCRSVVEAPKFVNLTEQDKDDLEEYFNGPVVGESDQDALNEWYRIVDGIVARHKAETCVHDSNLARVDARLHEINELARQRCRHGATFAEYCEDCDVD